MVSRNTINMFLACCICACVMQQTYCNPHPQLDIIGGYDIVGVCVRNCAQCKNMFAAYFNGEMCAESCLKFNGKIIPDCEDLGSITPFLNKFD